MKELTVKDFRLLFGDKMTPYIQDKILQYQFKYRDISRQEFNRCIVKICQMIFNEEPAVSGEQRKVDWAKGWGQNLSIGDVYPKYFGKYPYVRWKGNLIKPLSFDFEINMLYLLVDWVSDKYMRDCDVVYDFGCGTGHCLKKVRDVNPHAELWGLDWVSESQSIVDKLGFNSYNFNFFAPDYKFEIKPNSVVYTVAALEQVGTKYHDFVQYLLNNQPRLCIHIEPIIELLDASDLLDYLCKEYCKKRNYLSGFLPHLEQLEKSGIIKILFEKRTHIGSFLIEGYSVVVWQMN